MHSTIVKLKLNKQVTYAQIKPTDANLNSQYSLIL